MAEAVTEYPRILPPQEELRARMTRARLEEKLTPTQYRRVAMLYGLDGGEEMSERQVAKAEEVSRPSVQEARDAAFAKMRHDVCLLLLWIDT